MLFFYALKVISFAVAAINRLVVRAVKDFYWETIVIAYLLLLLLLHVFVACDVMVMILPDFDMKTVLFVSLSQSSNGWLYCILRCLFVCLYVRFSFCKNIMRSFSYWRIIFFPFHCCCCCLVFIVVCIQ